MFRLAQDHCAEHDREKSTSCRKVIYWNKPIHQLVTQGIWLLQLLVKKPKFIVSKISGRLRDWEQILHHITALPGNVQGGNYTWLIPLPKTLKKAKAASLGMQRRIGRVGLVLKKTGGTRMSFFITISTALLTRVFCSKHKAWTIAQFQD